MCVCVCVYTAKMNVQIDIFNANIIIYYKN